jgi:hypothetical protein
MCAQFPVEFVNSAQAVLQLCQYNANIAGESQARQKWLYNRTGSMLPGNIVV